MRAFSICVVAIALSVLPAATAFSKASLPADSVYQANIQLTDAHAHPFTWSEKRGQPQLVSMFYTSCTVACPMLVDSAKAVLQRLTFEERAGIGLMLISLDPKRDTPKVLARAQKERSIDASGWTLAQPNPRDVRKIAGLLGIRYRALADGDFNHTTALILLDADGRIVARTEQMGGRPDPAFLVSIQRTLAGH